MLPDVHTNFSRGRSGGLVFPSLSEFSTVYCDPPVKSFGIVNKAEIDVFLELSCFFYDPADVGNLIRATTNSQEKEFFQGSAIFPIHSSLFFLLKCSRNDWDNDRSMFSLFLRQNIICKSDKINSSSFYSEKIAHTNFPSIWF